MPNAYIFAANLPGCLASTYYVVATLPLLASAPRERAQVQILIVLGAAAELMLWGYIIFNDLEPSQRNFLLGLYASLLCVLLFASPLSTIREVLASGSAASIYAPLMLTQCVNCGTWQLIRMLRGSRAPSIYRRHGGSWCARPLAPGIGAVRSPRRGASAAAARRGELSCREARDGSCQRMGATEFWIIKGSPWFVLFCSVPPQSAEPLASSS